MLQQTQVSTVIPYYQRFMVVFPDIRRLAAANIDDVLHLWAGLGYYARARNMHKTAVQISRNYGSEFPTELDKLMSLPGIGRSTAGAILSLSGGEPHPILDGNVKRVLSRYYAVKGWPGSAAVSKVLWNLAERNTPRSRGADYTQGIMDLGAMVCTRRRPHCDQCPLRDDCLAHTAERETAYPERKAKTEKAHKSTNMLVVRYGSKIYLEKRPEDGIWGGLYSFPEVKSKDHIPLWIKTTFKSSPSDITALAEVKHSFTHLDLDIQPFVVWLKEEPADTSRETASIWHEPGSLLNVGVAAPISGLIQTLTTAGCIGSKVVLLSA